LSLEPNSLRGFAKVVLPSGMVLHDISIHVAGNRAWASPASKPMLDRSGIAMKDDTGKIRYSPIVSFATREGWERFSDAIIEAIRFSHPSPADPGGGGRDMNGRRTPRPAPPAAGPIKDRGQPSFVLATADEFRSAPAPRSKPVRKQSGRKARHECDAPARPDIGRGRYPDLSL
jgi:hypothetical protein